MTLNTHTTENHSELIGHIGWKYYNTIKKKAMEQEFSWSGLLLSMSIAFFIVVSAALVLNVFYNSLERANFSNSMNENLYKLEFSGIDIQHHYINTGLFDENKLDYSGYSILS